MRLPSITGVIRRRILANYRVDPAIVAELLPEGMAPKLVDGWAIAGICLIRLEEIRARGLPKIFSMSSENAAHRFAVEAGGEEAVYIPRRDTDSFLNHLVGGRLFPGVHHLADFRIEDDLSRIDFHANSRDGAMRIEISGAVASELPSDSIFPDLETASRFFENGALGYSDQKGCTALDGIRLEVPKWEVLPFDVKEVHSSYFDDQTTFPHDAIHFDHALLMRDTEHHWVSEPDFVPLQG